MIRKNYFKGILLRTVPEEFLNSKLPLTLAALVLTTNLQECAWVLTMLEAIPQELPAAKLAPQLLNERGNEILGSRTMLLAVMAIVVGPAL